MKTSSKIFLSTLVLAVGVLLWQKELVSYGLMQAKGQLRVVQESKPIEFFLADSSFPDSLKAKLRLIEEVRQFSFNELGINQSNNYTTVFDQKGKVSLWNLTASEPFKLEAKQWTFPLLGSFPYKGFFELEKAKKERDDLKNQGYDTRIRPVSGWSTLGWFDDPILSNMLYRSEGRLAELIIHELTHGTLYIKDSASYNENLATFIGEKGAEKFLIEKYGIDSNELNSYLNEERDSQLYVQHFIRGASKLDSVYRSMSEEAGFDDKEALKKQMIQMIVDNLDTINFSDARYHNRFQTTLPNNTYFMSFLRYHSKKDRLEEEYKNTFNSDINSYLTYLKQKYPSL